MNEEQEINEQKRQVLLHLERTIFQLVKPLFMDDVKISLLVHAPGNPAANVLITQENEHTRCDAVSVFRTLMRSANNRGVVGD